MMMGRGEPRSPGKGVEDLDVRVEQDRVMGVREGDEEVFSTLQVRRPKRSPDPRVRNVSLGIEH